jgi:predicted PurR-regulated permease PerM
MKPPAKRKHMRFPTKKGYNTNMQFLRKAALTAAASLFGITLFSFGLTWSLYQVFSTPHQLKTSINESGLYDSAVATILKEKARDPSTAVSGDLPVNNPELQKVIEDAFPPQLLKTQAEQVIDSSYSWISGDASSLQFSLDFTQAKTNLANGMQQYAQKRLGSLPQCTADTIPTGDVDAFNATCLPPGADVAALAQQVHDKIMGGDFLKDTKITPETLKTSDGKSLQSQLHAAPDAYKYATWSVYGGALLALLLAVAIVFLSATRRGGVRRVAIASISIGICSVILGVLSSLAVHQLVNKITNTATSNTSLQPQVSKLAQSLADDLRNWWAIFGLTCVLCGIATLIALHATKPKNPIDLRTQGKPRPNNNSGDLVPEDAEKPKLASRHEHTLNPPTHDEPNRPPHSPTQS